MNTIQYNYEIISVDQAARVMEVVYTSDGRQTMHIGARLPYVGEALEAIVDMYAPVGYWREQEAQLAPVEVGLSGTLGVQPIVTLESSKTQKLAEVANWRYLRECSGVVANGVQINTDRIARSQLLSAYFGLGENATVDWKTGSGWITFDKASMLNAITVIEAHVQQAFADEKAIAAQVAAAQTIDEVNAIILP
jgi:hypothetical protein